MVMQDWWTSTSDAPRNLDLQFDKCTCLRFSPRSSGELNLSSVKPRSRGTSDVNVTLGCSITLPEDSAVRESPDPPGVVDPGSIGGRPGVDPGSIGSGPRPEGLLKRKDY